jgi:hypothetical protein
MESVGLLLATGLRELGLGRTPTTWVRRVPKEKYRRSICRKSLMRSGASRPLAKPLKMLTRRSMSAAIVLVGSGPVHWTDQARRSYLKVPRLRCRRRSLQVRTNRTIPGETPDSRSVVDPNAQANLRLTRSMVLARGRRLCLKWHQEPRLALRNGPVPRPLRCLPRRGPSDQFTYLAAAAAIAPLLSNSSTAALSLADSSGVIDFEPSRVSIRVFRMSGVPNSSRFMPSSMIW